MPRKKKPASVTKAGKSRSAIGRQSRAFGKTFERMVVHEFKEFFQKEPWAEHIRRSDQSHRAWLPDVTGVPGLWPECQVAANVQPAVKLLQAIRDVKPYRAEDKEVIPVAITRRKGQQMINATITAGDLELLMTYAAQQKHSRAEWEEIERMPVTFNFDFFLTLFRAAGLYRNPDFAPFSIDTEALRRSIAGEHPSELRKKQTPDTHIEDEDVPL